ncbi:MAG: thiamine-phosphate kinase [Alphaproteobacteria bacterium]
MNEFDRIARYFAPLSAGEAGAFALTDDAAALAVPAGQTLVVTTDSVIEGIHLPRGASPAHFAQKLLRRNLSDLAAMGAAPWRYLLNLHVPATISEEWLQQFSAMLQQEQQHFGIVLVGGDSTTGSENIHLTATLLGLTPEPLLRRGAKAGDDLYVTGTIGEAALALPYALGEKTPDAAVQPWLDRYFAPEPRIAVGLAMRGIASAAIDISDGLVQDFTHLCKASDLGAVVHIPHIPLARSGDIETMLTGGDDYELLFTAPASKRQNITAVAAETGVAITRIGAMQQHTEVVFLDAHNQPLHFARRGYRH